MASTLLSVGNTSLQTTVCTIICKRLDYAVGLVIHPEAMACQNAAMYTRVEKDWNESSVLETKAGNTFMVQHSELLCAFHRSVLVRS